MPSVLEKPDIDNSSGTGTGGFCVVIYNNSHNTFEEVIQVLCRTLGITEDSAELHAWDAHLRGEASVYFSSSESDCQEKADKIASIGMRTEVREEA
ncbi:MAG: ATP-dependent Clp protease adaptor ClpS [Armatimonadetes bacterium]|nr:ATP-dependent Clp protease adaptor ClpS [Armatimonadota bacterium]